jgi:hypothetical protein
VSDSDGESPEMVIFRAFAQAATPGWVRGEIDIRYAGKTAERSARAFDGSGNVSYPRIRGFELGNAAKELRDRFAQAGSGAWFSVRINLTADGGFSLDADYDNEPAWKTPTDSGHYVEEQERYPRDFAHQPEWYRQKLAEAADH